MARKVVRKVIKKLPEDMRTITVRDVTCKVGQVAATAVQIDKSIDLQEIVVFFQYAQTILTNPRVILGTALKKVNWSVITNLANPGIILLGLYGATLPEGIMTLAELRFDLMAGVNVGDQGTIAIVESKVNPAPISVQGVDGSVTVVA